MQTRSPATDTPTPEQAFQRALAILGGQTGLGVACGVAQPSVNRWVHGKGVLPGRFVLAVEAASGVSRHHLRPDYYPCPAGTTAAVIPFPPAPVACDRKAGMKGTGTPASRRPRRVKPAPSANDNCCCPCHRVPPAAP